MKKMKLITGCIATILFSSSCLAGVVLEKTRVIYESDKKEATLTLTNTRDSKSYLVQSWVTSSSDIKKKVPFVVTPPVFKLGGGKKGLIRIINIDDNLPRDRESLFWLNVKPIPAIDSNAQNELQVVIKSSIKLLYRPSGIKDDAQQAYKKLKFVVTSGVLDVYNPTPYYINLYSLIINGKAQDQISMMSPFSHNQIVNRYNKTNEVAWQAINDNGSPTDVMKVTF